MMAAAVTAASTSSSGGLDATPFAAAYQTFTAPAAANSPPPAAPLPTFSTNDATTATTTPYSSSFTSPAKDHTPATTSTPPMPGTPITSPPPPLADAHPTNSTSFEAASSSSLEKEKVLGVTILTQLQELDLAIKLREQNKVDGRKTRWIEHRKQQEELGKFSPEAGGRKRRSGGKKKESLDAAGGVATPPLSSADDASPTKRSPLKNTSTGKPLLSPLPQLSPSDNNNTRPAKLLKNAGDGSPVCDSTMKMEVAEPLVGSVEPSNVLETMKQQFLQDTTKVDHLDSARLTNGVSEAEESPSPSQETAVVETSTATIKKKMKGKQAAEPSLKTGKKKLGRPAKIQQKLPTRQPPGKLLKKSKEKKAGKIIPVNNQKKSVTAPLPKNISISNFFTKQKTRGLREVRKPDGELSEDGSLLEEEVDEDKKPATVPLLLGTPLSKCPLIAAAAKIVSGKAGGKKAQGKAASKVAAMERKTRLSPLRTIANGIHGQEHSGEGVGDGAQKKKKQAMKLVKKATLTSADSGPLLPVFGGKGLQADNLDSASNASDASDSTTESGKRGRARGCKRKYQTDVSSVSPPPKCTKKTSTVVAEVHNSMNGEPQAAVAVSRSASLGRRKKQGGSPVKATLAVGNGTLPDAAEDSGSSSPRLPGLANGSPAITAGAAAAQTVSGEQLLGNGSTSDDVDDGSSEPANTQQSSPTIPSPSNKSGGRVIATNSSLCNVEVPDHENGSLFTNKLASVSNNTRSSAVVDGLSTPPKAPIVTRSSSIPNTRLAANSEPSSPAPTDSEPSLLTSPIAAAPCNLPVTNSVHLSRTNSLPNGNSPRLVGRNLPPSKSSDQVAAPSNNVVPDKPSTFRRKNTSSPVKLIRTASLKSKDSSPSTTQQDSALECNINGNGSEVSRMELPKVASVGTKNSVSEAAPAGSQGNALSAAARKPTECLAEAKQNNTTSKKSPKSSIRDETRQSSPRSKTAPVTLVEEAVADTAIAALDCGGDARTKSPTGSDCDNNNSSGLPIRDKSLIADTKMLAGSLVSDIAVNGSVANGGEDKPKTDTEKPVGKVPRYLKQLFKDEGVQNMLKSIEEDSLAVDNGSAVTADPVAHKLRPKRPPEHAMAVSPEPEIEMYFSSGSSKRRRKYNELDTLYMDEGALNLLTSIENSSRRGTPVQDELVPAVVGRASADASDRAATAGDGQVAKATAISSSSSSNSISGGNSCLPESVRGSPSVNGPVVDLTGDSFEESVSGSTASMKRKPGRPQKLKANRFKSSSPAGAPDVELEQENVHNASKKARLDLTVTARKHDDGLAPVVISLTTKGNSRGAMTECSGGATNGPLTSGGKGGGGSVQVAGGKPPPTTSAATSHRAGGATSASASGGGGPGRPATVPSVGASKPQPPHTSPVRMRRVDLPTSPTMASLDSLVRSLEEGGSGGAAVVPTSSVAFVPHRAPDGLVPPLRGMRGLMALDGAGLRQSQRSSARHSTATDVTSVNYRDIVLRKMNNFVHIIMAPQTTKIKNSLNSRVLRELCAALSSLRSEPSVRLVLITSNGSSWCQGVDLTSLHHPNPETRNNHAHNLARAIKEFLKMLVQFPKPIIAGVNGNAMGLGVTMLPLFDMVFASDSAEFFLPYSKLGQVPEGGATYTFPTLLGKLQSTRLFMGHKFSASEGVQMGLVSEVLWPANFQETLLPKVALLATQSAQSMEATKALMNHHLLTKLELSVESECHTLLKQWTSSQFEALSRRFLDTHAPLMQKPVVVPL